MTLFIIRMMTINESKYFLATGHRRLGLADSWQ